MLNKRNYWIKNIISSISIVLAILIIIKITMSAAGNVCGNSSPCACGANCNGGYETGNGYNTIDSCQDGNDFSYEYVQDVGVTDVNDSTFSVRDTITIDGYVQCPGSDLDPISFNYNNGSGWKK